MTRDDRTVLVVGVYLVDKENTAAAAVAELNGSREWTVEQRWLALGTHSIPDELAAVTVGKTEARVPKFMLLNRLLADTAAGDYAFIIVCDDDVTLPSGFLDDYLKCVERYDFALAQPARTHDSYIDHAFVEQLDGLSARWTQFVEIGPLFSIRRDAAAILLPFDDASPMGWGYDFVWPLMLGDAGLKLGIVDATAVGHSLRPPVAEYDYNTVNKQMRNYLRHRRHLSKQEAFFIVESYA